MPRVFYRTVYEVEVLSEDPMPDGIGLDVLHEAITTGDCSGVVRMARQEQLDGPTARAALIAQDTDPEFFMLGQDGRDLLDDDEADLLDDDEADDGPPEGEDV